MTLILLIACNAILMIEEFILPVQVAPDLVKCIQLGPKVYFKSEKSAVTLM